VPGPPRAAGVRLAGAVALTLTLLGLVAAGAAAGKGLTTGFADSLFQDPSAAVRNHWLKRAHNAGSKLVRLNVLWAQVAPSKPASPRSPGDPAYQFGGLDAAVKSAKRHHMKVLMTVLDAPVWAEGPHRPGSADPGTWRPKAKAFGAFGHALAKRYSGHSHGLPAVRFYEAWNEPNLSAYLTPQYRGKKLTSAPIYRKMLNAFYKGVHSASGKDRVVSGGLAPYGEPPGHDRTRPLTFLRKLLCLKGRTGNLHARRCRVKAHIDIVGDHPIDTSGGPHTSAINPNDVATPDFKNVRQTVRAAERHHSIKPGGRRPLWATEIWWETNPPDHHFGVKPRKQARYLGTALKILKRQGASVVINLQIRDSATPANGDGTTATGVYFRSGKPKPSLRAWRAHSH
jgi:hypothetical protein